MIYDFTGAMVESTEHERYYDEKDMDIPTGRLVDYITWMSKCS